MIRSLLASIVMVLATSWNLQANPPVVEGQGEDAFQFVVSPGATGWAAMRLNTATGETWTLPKDDWIPLKEPGNKQPTTGIPGTYRVVMFRTEDNKWDAMRVNLKTGQSWLLDDGAWDVEIPVAKE